MLLYIKINIVQPNYVTALDISIRLYLKPKGIVKIPKSLHFDEISQLLLEIQRLANVLL